MNRTFRTGVAAATLLAGAACSNPNPEQATPRPPASEKRPDAYYQDKANKLLDIGLRRFIAASNETKGAKAETTDTCIIWTLGRTTVIQKNPVIYTYNALEQGRPPSETISFHLHPVKINGTPNVVAGPFQYTPLVNGKPHTEGIISEMRSTVAYQNPQPQFRQVEGIKKTSATIAEKDLNHAWIDNPEGAHLPKLADTYSFDGADPQVIVKTMQSLCGEDFRHRIGQEVTITPATR